MTNKQYIIKLFSKASDQLGVPFVKTTPTKLQSWATKQEPPFIALINNLPRDTEKNDLRNNIYAYECVFMICGSTKKDPSIEDKINLDVDLETLADRFTFFVERGEKVLDVTNINGEELFRGTTFYLELLEFTNIYIHYKYTTVGIKMAKQMLIWRLPR